MQTQHIPLSKHKLQTLKEENEKGTLMFNDAIGTRSGLLAHLFANTSNHSSSSAPRAAIERDALPSTCHSTASPRNVLSNKRMSAQADDSRTGITTFSLHTGSDDAAAGVEPSKCSTSISILKKSSCPHTCKHSTQNERGNVFVKSWFTASLRVQ